HGVRVLRVVRRDPRRDQGRTRPCDRHHGLQALERRLHRPEPVLVSRAVRHAHVRRHSPDDAPVPVRREEGHVLMATVVGTHDVARPQVIVTVAESPGPRPFPWGTVAVHGFLVLAVVVIAFPLYYAFVISTQDLQEVVQRPPLLVPSSHLVENYVEAWQRSHMARLLVNSAIVAVVIAVGKIAISMLSAFAIVYFRF